MVLGRLVSGRADEGRGLAVVRDEPRVRDHGRPADEQDVAGLDVAVQEMVALQVLKGRRKPFSDRQAPAEGKSHLGRRDGRERERPVGARIVRRTARFGICQLHRDPERRFALRFAGSQDADEARGGGEVRVEGPSALFPLPFVHAGRIVRTPADLQRDAPFAGAVRQEHRAMRAAADFPKGAPRAERARRKHRRIGRSCCEIRLHDRRFYNREEIPAMTIAQRLGWEKRVHLPLFARFNPTAIRTFSAILDAIRCRCRPEVEPHDRKTVPVKGFP